MSAEARETGSDQPRDGRSPRPTLPAHLPSVARAALPATYEEAKATLAKCSEIDECAGWADKAAAMASYAKQADDDSLFQYATRIRARAIRRCGELLRAIAPAKGGRPSDEKPVTPAAPVSRSQAARDAGLSERQQVTALRVAAIPERDFERAVEAPTPPTVTQLAKQGTRPAPKPLVDLQGRDPEDFAESTRGQGHLERLAEYARRVPAARVVRGALPHEYATIRRDLDTLTPWLHVLAAELARASRRTP